MDAKPCPSPLDRLPPLEELYQRLEDLDAEQRALRILVRAQVAAERSRKKQSSQSGQEGKAANA